MNKIKTFFIIYLLCCFPAFLFIISDGSLWRAGMIVGIAVGTLTVAFMLLIFSYGFGLNKIIQEYFDRKTYAEQDEATFQRDLRREVTRKRALAQVDNENLHYQNQLRIEYIAKVAYIHLQSNQQLANMYQQAIISNSNNQENIAQNQLIELEKELERQGLI